MALDFLDAGDSRVWDTDGFWILGYGLHWDFWIPLVLGFWIWVVSGCFDFSTVFGFLMHAVLGFGDIGGVENFRCGCFLESDKALIIGT